MANEKHLAILKQGVRVWNEWRKQIAFYRQETEVKRQENTRLLGIIETMAEQESRSLNELQINILKAIDKGISSERELANILKLEKHLVRYHLQYFEKNEFIKGAKGFPIEDAGEKEYVSCWLTDKGKVAAENPSNLIKESIMTENRIINVSSGDYNENRGNVGISHMSGGEIKEGAKVAGVINEAERQNLAEAAAEIQQLLEQLSQTYPTSTNKEKMAVVAEAVDQIENNPTLKARVINALKAGGTEAFKEAINHPLVNILIATIEGWQEAE